MWPYIEYIEGFNPVIYATPTKRNNGSFEYVFDIFMRKVQMQFSINVHKYQSKMNQIPISSLYCDRFINIYGAMAVIKLFISKLSVIHFSFECSHRTLKLS